MRLITSADIFQNKDTNGYDVDEILEAIDGLAFLETEYEIDFIPQSGEMKACCPLPSHPDRTPSFNFNPVNKMWRCYGCGKSGTLLGLVMKIEACSKQEAIFKLAEAAGYEPVTDPGMVIEKTSRSVTKLIDAYLHQKSSSLPGQVSALTFMNTVREKIQRVSAQFPNNSDVFTWAEKVYMRLDDCLLSDDHRGCRQLWQEISDQVGIFKQQARSEMVI